MTIETTVAAVLGGLPFNGAAGINVNSATRAAVRTWLGRCGWPMAIARTLEVSDCLGAYTNPERYSQLSASHNGPAIDAQAACDAAIAPYMPRNENLLAWLKINRPHLFEGNAVAQTVPTVQAGTTASAREGQAMTRETVERFNPPPVSGDKAAELARILSEMVGSSAAPMDDARVIDLIQRHAPKPEAVERFIVLEREKPAAEARALDPSPKHEAFPEVLDAVDAGLNVLIVGPAGSGKTHLAAQVADALNLRHHFTGAVESKYELLGFQDAQGRTVRKTYREAYEHGGVFLFDEIDASAPGSLLSFNAGLANGHQDFPDCVVERHPDFRAIASANTYGRGQDRLYVGRNQLDAASLDRFVVLPIDYDAKMERALFGDTPWVSRVHSVRAAVATLKVRHVVSMRAIQQGAALLARGWKQDRVEAACLWKGLDADTVAKIDAEAR